jgi:hypothetical protein
MDRTAAAARPRADFELGEPAGLRWRDPWVSGLIALTLALQFTTWSRVSGYQIADSVEFMEIAQSIVRGETRVDADTIRPIGFSFVLMPFFALADWIGLRDPRAVVWCVTLVEILLGCVLVVVSARIGARIGGRTCGLAAGFLVATNPVFLQYSTQPESGIPAGVCIALALEKLLFRAENGPRSRRDAFVGGLWWGAAFLIAYKTLLISGVFLVLLLARDRWRHRHTWILAGCGLAIALFVQSLLDLVMYGMFGASIFNYLAQNAGSVLTSVLVKLHMWIGGGIPGLPLDDPRQPKSFWILRASEVYEIRTHLTGDEFDRKGAISVQGLQSQWFYVFELPRMLVWPTIALFVLGTVAGFVKRNRTVIFLVVLVAANLAATSNKGRKEFRLWLPLLAIVTPIAAFGFGAVVDASLARAGMLRRLAAFALFASISLLSVRALMRIDLRLFGGYWEAMDWVNARALESLPERAEEARRLGLAEPRHVRVAAAYHWAVFHRGSPVVDPVKLPWQLNEWDKYAPDKETGFVVKHLADMSALEQVDVFVVHLPILSEHPQLMRWVASQFDVAAAFYDQETYGDLGPIFVLERRSADPRGRRFLEEHPDQDARAFQAERQLSGAFDFFDPRDPEGDRLELLGVEYQTVPPQGFGWITYHWRAPRRITRDWTLVDRVTAPEEARVWDNGHQGAYGALPTSMWEPGTIVSEGYLLIPASEAYREGAPFRPIGGAYRRGDLLPVRCWMGVREYGPETTDGSLRPITNRLFPARPGALDLVRPIDETELYQTPDGTQFSADGLVRIHGLLMPVLESARLPDDGRPNPE